MAISQGLIDTYWRRYNQRRALTGLPASYQEQRGMLDPMLEYAAKEKQDEARLKYQYDLQNRQLSLQEKAYADANRAATISGISQLAGTGLSGYLGYKYLTKPDLAGQAMAKYYNAITPGAVNPAIASTAAGAGSGSMLMAGGVGSGASIPMMAAMNPATTAAAPITYGSVAGEMGAGLGAGSAAPGLLSTAGPAALGVAGGSLLGKPVSKLLGTGPKTTENVMGIAGGAAVGFAVGGPVGGLIGAALGGLASLF